MGLPCQPGAWHSPGLGAAGRFQELQLQWGHLTGGCAGWCPGFVALEGEKLAREDAESSSQHFPVPSASSLVPFRSCYCPKVAGACLEEVLQSLWAAAGALHRSVLNL